MSQQRLITTFRAEEVLGGINNVLSTFGVLLS